MAVKRSLWDMILKVVIAVASAVLGVVGHKPHCKAYEDYSSGFSVW